jgi:hypothetical protein
MLLGMVTFSKAIFSRGQRTIRRYWRHRRAELLEPAIAAEIDLLLGWPAVVGGGFWLFLSLVIVIMVSITLGYHYLGIGWRDEAFHLFYERGPRLDFAATVVAALALLSLGLDTVKWGYRRVRPFRHAAGFAQLDAAQGRRSVLLFGCLRSLGGGIAVLAAVFLATEILVNLECVSHSRGTLPDWVPLTWWSFSDLVKDCRSNFETGLNLKVAVNLAVNVIVSLSVLAFAVIWLVRGVPAFLGVVGHRSGQSPDTRLGLPSTLRGGA